MIKQYMRKRAKIAWGFYNTYIRKVHKNYTDIEWWDTKFYTEGISDRQTISPKKSSLSSLYHYNSVEMAILKHFYNNKISLYNYRLLDIGSGSGHWIDFYLSLGSSKAVGVDVSVSSVNFLKNKYENNQKVKIFHGSFCKLYERSQDRFDLVNAIGVMFHIVDDYEWKKSIKSVSNLLRKNGIFIIGGHFGYLDKLNVQVDKNKQVNKRLRSIFNWKKTLKDAGFSKTYYYSNNAYLWIKDPLPENNLLIAVK